MKLQKLSKYFLALLIALCSFSTVYAGDSTFTKVGEYHNGDVIVYQYKYSFAADSLRAKVTNIIPILNDSLVSISITASGSAVKNFHLNVYLTNLVNSSTMQLGDTVSWNLKASYDTTGLYTNKPVNKALIPRISDVTFAGLACKLTGLAGNRKDVIVYLHVVMRKRTAE